MENYIKGIFRQAIFKSDNGYVIGLFKVTETDMETMKDYVNKIITITGYFADINDNENYYFNGEETVHPKYGFQFNVKSYERVKPEDIDGIVQFLSSDLFKGIGEKMAKRIVNTLGKNTLDLILKDKTCLDIVPKLSAEKKDLIYNNLIRYEESHEIIVKLTEYGFSMRDALSIYNTYKHNTLMIFEHNPYHILEDNVEISFSKIDMIARKLNIDPLDLRRIDACIIYIMNELCFKNGDTYLHYSEIYESVCSYTQIDISSELFNQALCELESERKVIIENDKYYLEDLFDAENNIAYRLKKLASITPKKINNLDEEIKKLEEKNGISYNDEQKDAIKKALDNNILVITGGPGTGKTTIIKAIVLLYQQIHHYSLEQMEGVVSLLAPTGRASKRMSEATTLSATTIHRFLKWDKDSNTFCVNEYNPNYSNLIIVDEASMIDTKLMDSLLKGLTNNIKLILVGDYDQLPSVGPGTLLKDIINSGIVDTIYLKELYRQSDISYIPVLAQEIRNNQLSNNFTDSRDDYKFLTCSDSSIVSNLVGIVKQVISAGYDYKRVQLMAPVYANRNGIDNLNKVLQTVFNPSDSSKVEIKYGDVIYRENDKVLQLVNIPDLNVFNGDIGIIKSIKIDSNKSSNTEIVIDFDGNLVTYKHKDLVNIKHGFIISIHKSQGSEFELVIIPISNDYKRMLYRKLIYTAITRAKRKLILIGDANAFISAVNNNLEQARKTGLLEKLTYFE